MSSLVYSLRGRLRRVDQEKLWTYVLTAILVLAIYLVVRQITIEEPRFDVEKFAEIDFTRFQPPKPKSAEPEKKPTEKVEKEAEPTPTQNEIPQIDLSKLEELMSDPTPQDLSPLQRIATLPSAMQMPEINVGTTIKPPINAPVIQNRPNPNALQVLGTPSNVYNPNLRASKVGYGGTPNGAGYSTGRKGAISGKKGANTSLDKVNVKNFSDADLKKVDFAKLFMELLSWVRENQVELTPAVKRYMHYKTGDLTTQVSISTGELRYDLFLLCNEQSQDIGLLLVAEGDSTEATMLRDTGFRKTSHSLFQGIAGRNEDDEVLYVSMLERKPTLEETSKFYNIFLSWWHENKPKK